MTLYIETVSRSVPPNAPPGAVGGAQATITADKPKGDKPIRTIPFSGAMTPQEFTKRVNAALGLATADPACVVELTIT